MGSWLASSGGPGQSVLDAAGPQSSALAELIWLFIAVLTAVWLLVMLALVLALRARRQAGAAPRERSARLAVGAAMGTTVAIITGLTVASFLVTRELHRERGEPLVIKIRGYQWWWEVTYPDASPDRQFATANELRIPVGRPVRIELSAADVIHSFWVPSLAGKQDLIPGRDNAIALLAERAGIYRGPCAEFCGLQHARMTLLVVAEPEERFEEWRRAQRAEAAAPANGEEARGRRIVEGKACAACHTIRGTAASGTLGPDLTHVASRETIAAGTLPTSRGSLAAWILDPQTIKPGSKMPAVPLSPEDLRAVTAYLAALR